LISDDLVAEDDFHLPTSVGARDLLDTFGDSLFTMIAVMCHPAFVADIERTISHCPDEREFGESLDRCLRKLVYLRKPPKDPSAARDQYEYRVLRFEDELQDYFRFRHDVYSVMCYLGEDAERAPSAMEIDWFDKSSVHLGVYHDEGGYRRLVGTGRLIATERIPKVVPDAVERLASLDPLLRRAMDNAVGLRLPVLQSHDFVELVDRFLDSGMILGEVSRITVAAEHRGFGLSLAISEHLIDEAKKAGLCDLLLECLPIHAAIYQKCKFRLVPRARGHVYKVGRTMDVMALPLGSNSILPPRFLGATAGT